MYEYNKQRYKMSESQHEPSTLMKWFASVTPLSTLEDFEQVREAFEHAVAEEVIAEFENFEIRSDYDQYYSR